MTGLTDEVKLLLTQDFQTKKNDLRLVQDRYGDRRISNQPYQGSCRRREIRRTAEQNHLERQKQLVHEYKQENQRLREKNARLRIPQKEEILWRLVVFGGVAMVFAWEIIINNL